MTTDTYTPQPSVFPSFETPNLIVRLPPRSTFPLTERIDGETWAGVTRTYLLYPMIPGQFSIPAQTVTVIFADPDTNAPVTVELQTDPFTFTGTVPEGAENLDPFIAADALILEQSIEGGSEILEPGDAVTRTVTVRLQSLSPMFLPPLIPPLLVDGLSAYPKEPVLNETEDRDGLSGERIESVTYVAEAGGRYTAPPVRLQWFNLKKNRVETVAVEGFDIAVDGPPPAPPPAEYDWREMLPLILAGLVAAIAVALLVRRFRPRFSIWRQRRAEARYASEAFAFMQAVEALRRHDFSDALHAIELWKSRARPAGPAMYEDLSAALAHIGAGFYGRDSSTPSDRRWNTAITALHTARRASLATQATAHALPPLNPGITI